MDFLSLAGRVGLVCAFVAPLSAQTLGQSPQVVRSAANGWAELVVGGRAEASFQPKADSEWEAAARFHLEDTQNLHGVAGETLQAKSVVFLPLVQANSTDKITVGFQQAWQDVPVLGGTVNVLMALDGSLLGVQSRALQQLVGTSATPKTDASEAEAAARDRFEREVGAAALEAKAPELVFLPVDFSPVLAWTVEAYGWSPSGEPRAWSYRFDATTGAWLESKNLVHSYDVGGTVMTMASPGLFPDQASNPATAQPLPNVVVQSSAGTVTTDANGNFNFPGVNAPLSLTVRYNGPFCDVDNEAGGEHAITVTGQPGASNTVLLNPNPNEHTTAQANAFLHVNRVRQWVRDVMPTDSTADFQAAAIVNIPSQCNAFWNGFSVNFYNDQGPCVNTAYSTVVAHEIGHWLNARYGTDNGFDGMGEGNADVWSMYVYDTAQTSHNFCGNGCNGRTGLNSRQYCGDGCSACYGQVHADGEVWMGAAWKIRANLNSALGDAAGDLAANTLFLSWMNAFDQTQIDSAIELQWLMLDDDDGNLDNGTPNWAAIDAGFEVQGFPGFDPQFSNFQNVFLAQDTTDEVGPYFSVASVTPTFAPALASVTVHYRSNGGTFQTLPALSFGTQTSAGPAFIAEIPGQVSPAIVEYYFEAVDANGNSTFHPANAPQELHELKIGELTVFLDDDFETNQGWTVGAPGDGATTGIWERVDPNGTTAQPANDHTNPGALCFVTGQAAPGAGQGANDVDGGQTTLLSPIFSLDGLSDPIISYWRWYSNDSGDNPEADVLRIEISNNGGGTWSAVETVGPSGLEVRGSCWRFHEFHVGAVTTPTANMQLRIVASDVNGGSIVEAAIDDVYGWDLGESGCGAPMNYGLGKLNSVGAFPAISFAGTSSMAVNDLEITLQSLVPNEPGQLFSGPASVTVPFMGGFRLVAFPIAREALGIQDGSGFVSVPVPIDASMLGTTRYYQWWYRDPAHPDGTGMGLSDGLAVEFCP